MPTSREIRQQFIDYFVERHGHRVVPSCPVVPHEDPTLLFTNAGMNQFKDVFLGTGKRDYNRAVNTQKCIRAGGKHNDLEDVGKDTYHHTFFEMLGNWSFGDYFKEEAITWAWHLLTAVWGLDKTRLHATVFGGDATDQLEPDREAAGLWTRVTDIDPSHVHTGSKKDNFWEMGDTGPCGPSSEIHIDLTPDKSGHELINADDARVIEIWNLVFIQFNRDASGVLSALPSKHVDTGMGFERICAILQDKASNYDTDVFAPIFEAIRQVTHAPAYGGRLDGKTDMAYRVIGDHIRCLTFAITDGAIPSNDGRGYVLRRILRRAVRHGWQTLEVKEPFLHRLVPAVVDAMGKPFPELTKDPQRVVDVIREEEESFSNTLDRGFALFEDAAGQASKSLEAFNPPDPLPAAGQRDPQHIVGYSRPTTDHARISAVDAFKLHDTYGFPLDLTQVMAQERGMTVDVEGFNRLMEEARTRARAGATSHDHVKNSLMEVLQKTELTPTQFVGYSCTKIDHQCVIGAYIWIDDHYEPAKKLRQGNRSAIVVPKSPYYAEAGGQVGDMGWIESPSGRFEVEDTIKVGEVYFHLGVVTHGEIAPSQPGSVPTDGMVELIVHQVRRDQITANHTGTHLMNRALREILGDHVQQKGSLVDDQKLRFDFSHPGVVTPAQIDEIQNMVNKDITADLPVYAQEAVQEQAIQINGLRAVFGEKYPPRVRVVSIGVPVTQLIADPEDRRWWGYSIEFCGGTHLANTGAAELFVIVGEEAVAKGVRRLTALTGQAACHATELGKRLIRQLNDLQQSPQEDRQAGAIAQLTAQLENQLLPLSAKAKLRHGLNGLQKSARDHQKQQSKKAAGAVVDQARRLADMSNGNVIVAAIDNADATTLRAAMDVIRKKRPETAMMLAGVSGHHIAFVAAVPQALIDKGLKAGEWVREVARTAGGGGGGRPDMAQAGGKDPEKLDEALRVGRQLAVSALQ